MKLVFLQVAQVRPTGTPSTRFQRSTITRGKSPHRHLLRPQ
ncbi:hypothetical protein [Kamptonema formosum]|nr:hypothetical protein [Oscillatoria sp. PCC 10802]